MIGNSIAGCTLSLSAVPQSLWQIYSGEYTLADIYAVADTQQQIQCQIYSTRSRNTFTGANTVGQILSGRYKIAKTITDIQHSKCSSRYMAADILWQKYNGGYTEVNIHQGMYSSRYSSEYTIWQTQ